MKRTAVLVLSLLMVASLICSVVSCSPTSEKNTETTDNTGTTDNKIHHVVITFEGYGDVYFELDANEAPITVDHFIKLITSGSYDNSYVNRLQSGFVLQAGYGCTDNSTIKGEFKSNGVNNTISHKKGVLSMARSNSKDSASNQFFVMLGDATYLDGEYAAFGHCTSGFEVIEKIAKDLAAKKLYADTVYYFLKPEAYIKMTLKVIN
ncbi:MAG: peptidylprolyl isomerase [Clostridiales bacterium]|nr:peptidylprolyl isomerase [Clostridiales bacterium]